MKCSMCNEKITERNDGFPVPFLIRYEKYENENLNKILEKKKTICTDCKKELLISGILRVV